jgi:hypothetical protein
VFYDVTRQQEEAYYLRLFEQQISSGENYVLQKMIIQIKGKMWLSDVEDYRELVSSLTPEITQFGRTEE